MPCAGPAVIEVLLILLFALECEVADLGASGWSEEAAAPTICRLSRAAIECVALAAPDAPGGLDEEITRAPIARLGNVSHLPLFAGTPFPRHQTEIRIKDDVRQ